MLPDEWRNPFTASVKRKTFQTPAQLRTYQNIHFSSFLLLSLRCKLTSSMKTLSPPRLRRWLAATAPLRALIGCEERQSNLRRLLRQDFMGKKFEQRGHVTCEVAPSETAVRRWCWRKFLAYPLKPEPKTTKEGFLSPGGTDVHADEEAGLLLHAWLTGADK